MNNRKVIKRYDKTRVTSPHNKVTTYSFENHLEDTYKNA